MSPENALVNTGHNAPSTPRESAAESTRLAKGENEERLGSVEPRS